MVTVTLGRFNLEETRDFMPHMGPMIGYAVTVVIEPSNPEHPRNNSNAPRAATGSSTLELSWHNLGGDRARSIADKSGSCETKHRRYVDGH